jgi:GTPase-activating protein SST2
MVLLIYKNVGRIVTTTTSTSFSIGREMARTIGSQFVQARLVEAAVDGGSASFEKDKSLWQITPKGMHVLHRFANRNGIASNTLSTLLASNLTTMNLIILERDDITDQILESSGLIDLIFRRFVGPSPNLMNGNRLNTSRRNSTGSNNSDHSGPGEQVFDGYTGVVMRDGKRIGDVVYQNCFSGQDSLNWLLECCTTVKESEAHHLAAMFLKHDLIVRCGMEHQRGSREPFDTNSYYILTERGKRMAGWTRGAVSRTGSQSPPTTARQRKLQQEEDAMSLVAAAADSGKRPGSGHGMSSMARSRSNATSINGKGDNERATTTRETSTAKLQQILNDPALLTLFREFLRQNFCEENLQFYRETGDFIKSVKNVETIEQVKASLATAFSHYNAFLAQGSPCELNLDHSLRLDLAARMAKAVDDKEDAIRSALIEVVGLFERARGQVLRLMASDSVPKFVQTWRYRQIYGEEHSSDNANLVTPPPETSRV